MTYPGSNWRNEDGEPYMTAAELRFEAYLDDEPDIDTYEDYGYAEDMDYLNNYGE